MNLIIELWKETYVDAYLDYFKKDKKNFKTTRMIYGVLFFLIFATGFLIMQQYVLLLLTPLAFLFGYKLPYFNLMSAKKKDEIKVSFLFPQFLQSFMALLPSSGNVYQTLLASTEYASEPLKGELEKLVKKIEKENNRDHYLEFADFIGTNEAYMIVDMIYQFSEFGVKKETLNDLRDYIQGLEENKVNELIERKVVRAEKYGYVAIFISLFFVLGYAGAIFMYYMQDVVDALNIIQ